VRIAVISPFVDRQHGTERAVAELIERLSAQYQDQIELYAQRVTDLRIDSSSQASENDRAAIRWHRVNSFPGPHLLQFLGWLMLNRSARERNENVTGQKSKVIFSAGINALDADAILVHVVFHRVAELQSSRGTFGLRALHRKLYYSLLCSLERRIYRNPSVTLAAVSPHTAQQLAHYFDRQDVTVVPNGVDAQHFSPAFIASMRERSRGELNYSPNDFVALLIGNDWRNKGLSTLLAAVSQCRDLPIRLLVVGQEDQNKFQTRARELLIADRVQFVSPASDVRTVYAAADVLAAPSLEDSFNLPVLEAMSCGLPVIVSPHAGISHWLTNDRDSLILKDPENIGELTGALRLMATDSAKRKAISENALQTAAKFSWDAHARDLRMLLVSAAERKACYKKT
jgi:UDP-glucose:(heptosyl)LPS alpha-1,3-glucosyltransferase